MLYDIPSILSPELLKIMMEMGHGDELCIGDGNFPSAAHAQRLVRLDGHGVEPIIDAVLRFFPLDSFVDSPVALMQVMDPATPEPPIWGSYRSIIESRAKQRGAAAPGIKYVERFAFYERAKAAYAIVATGETALYANIILKKGVVVE